MSINYQTQRVTVPTAFVTKGRQRVKQYSGPGNGTVYLKNGDEFEIELFNPTSNKVLAQISLNGKSLGSGIVLKPGERVFLERYFDEARKFLFETYEVDGNDPNVKQAIKLNGVIEVEFYDEYKPTVWSGGTITYTNTNPSWTYFNYTGGRAPGNPTFTAGNSGDYNVVGSVKSAKSNDENNVFFCSCNAVDMTPPAPLETGRVEKGANSGQSFTYDNTTFNTYYSWKTSWTILPESQRPLVKEDLSVYCSGCGAKRKRSTHRFCPTCGNRF
jgi:hypothetical protein